MRATLPLPRATAALALVLLAAGCAGSPPSDSSAEPAGASAPATGTWADGTVLRGTVTIPAGSTVTLAPGATVRAAKGATLVVAGTLLAPDGGRLTGSGWSGVQIVKGGKAALTGVALDGSENGFLTEEGALPSSLLRVRITKVAAPFMLATGTTLTLDDVKVTDISGASVIKGTLDGDRLSYDKAGNPGIVVVGGTLRLRDSLLYGNGEYDGDMVTTSKAREVTVSNTEVRDVHCAFHLVGVDTLTLDGLSLHDNAYGFMAYGSAPGQVHRITNTNVYDNRDFGLQESPGTEQGRIVVDGGYWGDNGSSEADTITQASGKIERVNPESAR